MNERVREYVDELSYLLYDRLMEYRAKAIALAKQPGLSFKDTLERIPHYKKELTSEEYSDIYTSLIMAFNDATENYFYNRLYDLGISELQIEEWQGDGLEIDVGVDFERFETPTIISRFKGIAFSRVYMDLTPEMLDNLNLLEEALEEELENIIKAQELDIKLSV